MRYRSRTAKSAVFVLVLVSLALNFGPHAFAHRASVKPKAVAQPNMVLEWNANAADAIVGVASLRPERGLIRLAMVHIAVYDAVNAINGYPFQAYGVQPTVISPASADAGTATAAHDMLVALFPDQQGDLDAKYAASLSMIPDGPAKANGIAVGQQTAAGILALRANDGRDATVAYAPGSGPGVWQPTPPAFLPAAAPEAAHVQPFGLISPSQFRAEPPPLLTSDTWARDYNEVKSLGVANGSSRTPEQTDIGRFWADQPILQWNRAWRNIAITQDLSLEDSARFFAMLATASADAIIACWDSKYTYNFWRPVTAIRAGGTDGNPNTEPDVNWIAQVVTPNHPEYPAAHGCFSGSSTQTLQFFFGTDNFNFTIDSKIAGLINPVRSYNSFSKALDEVRDARVYGGMHYRNSAQKGAILGQQVSRFVTAHFFRPTTGRKEF